MSTQTMEIDDSMTGTKPVPEHDWLKNLVGDWKTETEMTMPNGEIQKGHGEEHVINLGGLWSFGEGKGIMPDGNSMEYKVALGYDVSFKQYRGCWFASVSSHLWKYTGELSEDGKTMTLNCLGPSMTHDGETANYRDVIHLVDENHRTLTSYGQDDDGNWQTFMKSSYTRT